MPTQDIKKSPTDKYLDEVGEQIRWKRARAPLLDELQSHIIDVRNSLTADGICEDEAERLAVEQMGSPEETGTALDRIHRPQPNWTIIECAAILLISGFVLLASFGFPFASFVKMAAYSVCGVIFFLLGYFCDYTILGKMPVPVHFGMCSMCYVAAALINIQTASQICYILPLLFSAVVWKLRGKKYKAIMQIYAAGAACLISSLTAENVVSMEIYCIAVCTIVFVYAAASGWFDIPKRKAIPLSLLPAAAFLVLIPTFFSQFVDNFTKMRMIYALHPEDYPLTYGYIPLCVKELIHNSAFIGKGVPVEQVEQIIRTDTESGIFTSNYFLAAASNRFGWIVFAVIVLITAAITAAIITASKKQTCKLGSVVIIAVSASFAIRTVFYIACNLGFLLFELDGIPLFSYCGKLVVIDMLMLGLLLSVFRTGSISRDSQIKPFHIKRENHTAA